MAAVANKGAFQPDSDVHITFEDQQRINSFANQNAKLDDLREELKSKQNELQNLVDANDEIELFDEDELIPFLIGEVFINHNLSKTQELLAKEKEKIEKEIKNIEAKSKDIQDIMADLKSHLYGRFGSHIYLENEE